MRADTAKGDGERNKVVSLAPPVEDNLPRGTGVAGGDGEGTDESAASSERLFMSPRRRSRPDEPDDDMKKKSTREATTPMGDHSGS